MALSASSGEPLDCEALLSMSLVCECFKNTSIYAGKDVDIAKWKKKENEEAAPCSCALLDLFKGQVAGNIVY